MDTAVNIPPLLVDKVIPRFYRNKHIIFVWTMLEHGNVCFVLVSPIVDKYPTADLTSCQMLAFMWQMALTS